MKYACWGLPSLIKARSFLKSAPPSYHPPFSHHKLPSHIPRAASTPSHSSLQGHQQTPICQALWPLFDVSAFAALDIVDLSLEKSPPSPRNSEALYAPGSPSPSDSSCFFSHLITVARFQGPSVWPSPADAFPERPRHDFVLGEETHAPSVPL